MWLMDYDFSKSNEVRINENPSKNMYLGKTFWELGKYKIIRNYESMAQLWPIKRP
jgi:hypothetical protein